MSDEQQLLDEMVEDLADIKTRLKELERVWALWVDLKPEDIQTLIELYRKYVELLTEKDANYLAQLSACEREFGTIKDEIHTLRSLVADVEEDCGDLMKTKQIWKRRIIMEKITELGTSALELFERLGKMESTLSTVRIAVEQIQAENPDLNKDGTVTNTEKSIYNIAKMPWQEWMLVGLGLIGAFLGGLYVGGL